MNTTPTLEGFDLYQLEQEREREKLKTILMKTINNFLTDEEIRRYIFILGGLSFQNDPVRNSERLAWLAVWNGFKFDDEIYEIIDDDEALNSTDKFVNKFISFIKSWRSKR